MSDVLVVNAGEEIPADMVVLTSSSAEGDCFVETSNIDGESNLKVKAALSTVHHKLLRSARASGPRKRQNGDGEFVWTSAAHAAIGLNALTGSIRCELPNADVYRFAANVKLAKASAVQAREAAARAERERTAAERRLTVRREEGRHGHEHDDDSTDSEAEEEYVVGGGHDAGHVDLMALDDSNLLLRGSVLRSTGWVIGVTVYTGRQTKVAMNSAQPPSKLSRIERTINLALGVVLVAQIVLVVASDVLRLQWVADTYEQPGHDPWYLLDDGTNASANNASSTTGSSSSSAVGAGQETDWPGWIAYFFTFFILYNNMVPISMYFTVELCCFVQALYINRDSKMHCTETDTPARCRSTNLCQEIGQVSYIFADKTGTITRNEMVLKLSLIHI